MKNPTFLVFTCLAITVVILLLANQHESPPPSPAPPPASRTDRLFTDVPTSNPYWLFVEAAANQGIMNGYQCGGATEPCVPPSNKRYFRPDAAIIRAQLAQAIANMQHYTDTIPTTQALFADVPTPDIFRVAIERVARHGILTSTACGGAGEPCDAQHRAYFRPRLTVTRRDLAAVVALLHGARGPTADQLMADVSPAQPAYRAVQAAVGGGIMFGFPCGGSGEPCDAQHRDYFRPDIAVTRAELTEIIFLLD